MCEDAVARQQGRTGRFTRPYAGYQHFGIRLAGEFHELGAQVLLEGSPGQRRAGGQFVARLIWNVPHGDRGAHGIIMLLMLPKCKNGPRLAPLPTLSKPGPVQLPRSSGGPPED